MENSHTTGVSSAVQDRWVFRGLLALMVWAPLPLGSNRTWAIGILLLVVLLLVAGATWAWRRDSVDAFHRLAFFKWPLALLAAMLLLTWLQTCALPAGWVALLSPAAAAAQAPAAWMTLSLDVFQSRNMATLSFVFFATFVLVILTVRDAQRLDRLAQVLVLSGVLQAVLGAVLFSLQAQYQIFFSSVAHTRMIGSFVYHNSMAGYLCLCLSVGIGLMLARLGGKRARPANWRARVAAVIEFTLSSKMRLRLLLVVMVIALVLTRSRMGNAAFFSAMLFVGALAIVLARKTAPQTIALIVSLVIIDVLVVGTWVGLEKVVERIQDTELSVSAGGKSESVEARTEAARTAVAIVQDFPLFGSGGGSFYNVFLTYRTPQYGYSYVDHAHNDFVEIATDFGLLGLGILGVLVGLTFWTVLKAMRRRRSALPWGMAFGVAMAMVGMFVHSSVDFNLQIPANALTMVVILAMGWLAYGLPASGARRPTSAELIHESA